MLAAGREGTPKSFPCHPESVAGRAWGRQGAPLSYLQSAARTAGRRLCARRGCGAGRDLTSVLRPRGGSVSDLFPPGWSLDRAVRNALRFCIRFVLLGDCPVLFNLV